MKIVPNYKNGHVKCFYCNNNEAVESCGHIESIICISKTHLASYEYITANVEVPRCKECEKKHSLSMLPMLICFIGLFIFALIKVLIPLWLHAENAFMEKILYTLLMLFLSFAGGALIGFIPRMMISSLLKVKYEDDTDDYSPIRKLLDIGFRKDKPKAHTHPKAPYNKELYDKTLTSIIQMDNCVIQR